MAVTGPPSLERLDRNRGDHQSEDDEEHPPGRLPTRVGRKWEQLRDGGGDRDPRERDAEAPENGPRVHGRNLDGHRRQREQRERRPPDRTGQLRSHAENKTKRTFRPNLVNVTLMSDALKRSIRLRISAHALRSVEHRGGLDAFLLKAGQEDLSPRCLKLKREVQKAREAAPDAA